MPGLETADAWRQWAQGGRAALAGQDMSPPPIKEIPPLLRRRADSMGRAALHVLSRPELPYTGQAIVLCSRLGEFRRSFGLQNELARDGQVSPQQFSMSVHNATGGLFMMAQKARAPFSALAAGGEEALAGLQEAIIQLADGEPVVWLLYCEEPLLDEYRSLAASPDEQAGYFAFLLELVPGDDFHLAPDGASSGACESASPLDLLAFLLRPGEDGLCLTRRGGWTLRRTAVAGN